MILKLFYCIKILWCFFIIFLVFIIVSRFQKTLSNALSFMRPVLHKGKEMIKTFLKFLISQKQSNNLNRYLAWKLLDVKDTGILKVKVVAVSVFLEKSFSFNIYITFDNLRYSLIIISSLVSSTINTKNIFINLCLFLLNTKLVNI